MKVIDVDGERFLLCPWCDGSGSLYKYECRACGGSGKISACRAEELVASAPPEDVDERLALVQRFVPTATAPIEIKHHNAHGVPRVGANPKLDALLKAARVFYLPREETRGER